MIQSNASLKEADGTHTTHTEPASPRPLSGMDWTTWWLWRGARTRSLPELGRENPQRPWYCVLRHGRVGRRQVFQSIPYKQHIPQYTGDNAINTHAGWSSPVARQAHNLKVTGSNPVPATILTCSHNTTASLAPKPLTPFAFVPHARPRMDASSPRSSIR